MFTELLYSSSICEYNSPILFRVVVPVSSNFVCKRRNISNVSFVRIEDGLVISSDSSNKRQSLRLRIFMNRFNSRLSFAKIERGTNKNSPGWTSAS